MNIQQFLRDVGLLTLSYKMLSSSKLKLDSKIKAELILALDQNFW
jgi:hypothetical protein